MFLTDSTPKSSKLVRWSLALAEFNVVFCYRRGVENEATDCMSLMVYSLKTRVAGDEQCVDQRVCHTAGPALSGERGMTPQRELRCPNAACGTFVRLKVIATIATF